LRWIVLAVVITFPWTRAEVGFAFLAFPGHDSQRVSERLGKRHKMVGMWAHQMVGLVRRWLPDRSIKLMGDTAYTMLELGLYAKAKSRDPRHKGPIGCCARVGSLRLPALEQVLQDPETLWQKLTVD
jgi:hypothetical protein